jgi:uncharacterized protein YjbI with pentapeptide repeats
MEYSRHELYNLLSRQSPLWLRGADLSDADLSGANLSKANLSKANLRRVDLSSANLYSNKIHNPQLTINKGFLEITGVVMEYEDIRRALLA